MPNPDTLRQLSPDQKCARVDRNSAAALRRRQSQGFWTASRLHSTPSTIRSAARGCFGELAIAHGCLRVEEVLVSCRPPWQSGCLPFRPGKSLARSLASQAQSSCSPSFSPTTGWVLPVRRLGARNLLITAARITFRTLPLAEAFSLRPNLGEIHELSILGTTDARHHVSLDRISLW
jgi:hypothetical protein